MLQLTVTTTHAGGLKIHVTVKQEGLQYVQVLKNLFRCSVITPHKFCWEMYFLHILPSTICNTILLSGSSSLIVWIIVERELLQLMCCLPMQWTDNREILTLQLACCCDFRGLVRIFSRTLSCYLRLVDVYGPSEWFFCMFCTSPSDSNLIVI